MQSVIGDISDSSIRRQLINVVQRSDLNTCRICMRIVLQMTLMQLFALH
jgi:hypothetical protein